MWKLVSLLLILLQFACIGRKPGWVSLADQSPLHVYKTKADYRNLVPIGLSEDKTSVISYPHPSDVTLDNKSLLPAGLKKGYLLDRQGIGPNVAFLSMTYDEYAKRTSPLPLDSMLLLVVDFDPLESLYSMGFWGDYKNPEKEINALIKKDNLEKKGKRLK